MTTTAQPDLRLGGPSATANRRRPTGSQRGLTVVLTAISVIIAAAFILPAVWILIGSFRPTEDILSSMSPLGWQLLRFYPNMYTNTALPFMNHRFLLYYFHAGDDTLDMLTEPVRISNPKLYTPASLFWGLFGSLFAPETDVAVVYRKS